MKRVTYLAVGPGPVSSSREVEPESLMNDAAEAGVEFDPDELREFLAADLVDVPIDPAFKRRLRSKLWNLVRFRYGSRSSRLS